MYPKGDKSIQKNNDRQKFQSHPHSKCPSSQNGPLAVRRHANPTRNRKSSISRDQVDVESMVGYQVSIVSSFTVVLGRP